MLGETARDVASDRLPAVVVIAIATPIPTAVAVGVAAMIIAIFPVMMVIVPIGHHDAARECCQHDKRDGQFRHDGLL
jgi:hypothetical protein